MYVLRLFGRFRIPNWVLTIAVLLVLAMSSVVLGMLVGKGRTLPALGFVGILGAALMCLVVARYFLSFVLLLPVTCLAVPIDISTGTYTKLPISLLLATLLIGIWCASMYLRGWKIAATPLNRPIIVFGIICILSFAWGRLWRDPGLVDWNDRFVLVQVASLVTYLVSFATALLIGNFVTKERHLKWIVGVFLCAGTLIVLVQTLAISEGFLTIKGLWSLWLVAPAYGLLICQPKLKARWRILLIVLLLATFHLIMIKDSLWLSGWVPSLTAIFIITLLRSWKAFIALALVGLVCGYFAIGFFTQVAEDNVHEGGLERLDIWAQNMEIVRNHWLLGTGPAGYASYYATYYANSARSTHNNYFDILAQFGVVGALCWLWFVLTTILEGWRLIHRAPPGFLRTLAIIASGGWISAMGAMMLGDWVLPFAYNQTITGFKYTVFSWIFLGTLISIRQILDHAGTQFAASVAQVRP